MDSYFILGIAPGAGPAEIKRAYRRLAMAWHPDRNPHPDATEKFKQIRAAYDALQAREAPIEEIDVPESPAPEAPRADDIRLDLEITLEEAAFGCGKRVEYRRGAACPTCDGSGEAGISRSQFCPACHGSGRIRHRQHGLERCQECDGRGFFSFRTCPDCAGSGREYEEVSLQVAIPGGVYPGDELRLAGQGEPATAELAPGDLFLKLAVRSHRLFRLDGKDLSYTMPVSVLRLLAGGCIQVLLLDGQTLAVELEAGDPAPREIRLGGRGFPGRRNGPAGDLVIRLEPVLPRRLSAEQRRLLQEADAAGEENLDDILPEIAAWRDSYGV